MNRKSNPSPAPPLTFQGRNTTATNFSHSLQRIDKDSSGEPCNQRPHWDSDSRTLWFTGLLIKRFRRPAPVAETILNAFQEEVWKPHIDDPLAPLPNRHEAARLRSEVEALNRRLDLPLIRFFMDGTGEGLCWAPVNATTSSPYHQVPHERTNR
jgi:hypothetical protein